MIKQRSRLTEHLGSQGLKMTPQRRMILDKFLDAGGHLSAEELYDLDKDPHEVNNLAGDSRYNDILEEMRVKLKEMRERTKDPWLVLEDYKANRKL